MEAKKHKLIIAIPTLNRADLLNEALERYFEDFKDTHIAICDNGNQDIITREKNFMIYRPESNLGVARSWNMLMDYADKIGATHVYMLNDDVYSGLKEESLNAFIGLWNEVLFFNSEMNWSSYVLTVEAWKKVGGFDENIFPAYFEDNDFCYKLRLAGIDRINTSYLNPSIYRNSMTIAKDPTVNKDFDKNKAYYVEKWGGLPTEEKFTTPFNK